MILVMILNLKCNRMKLIQRVRIFVIRNEHQSIRIEARKNPYRGKNLKNRIRNTLLDNTPIGLEERHSKTIRPRCTVLAKRENNNNNLFIEGL